MKYYIIAGEASGDLHGSNLMKGIYAEDPDADIRFWGGDLMYTVWKDFTDRGTPLTAGGGAHDEGVGGVVREVFPDRVHKVSTPEAYVCIRVFCIDTLHQVRTVEIT